MDSRGTLAIDDRLHPGRTASSDAHAERVEVPWRAACIDWSRDERDGADEAAAAREHLRPRRRSLLSGDDFRPRAPCRRRRSCRGRCRDRDDEAQRGGPRADLGAGRAERSDCEHRQHDSSEAGRHERERLPMCCSTHDMRPVRARTTREAREEPQWRPPLDDQAVHRVERIGAVAFAPRWRMASHHETRKGDEGHGVTPRARRAGRRAHS